MFDTRPIGLIDSGIGGFTVLKEVQRRLPNENIIYLGDSYRMPYGELDQETIVIYADSDIRFLEARGVKAILLACNTVSSMISRLTSTVPLFSIVEAGCEAVLKAISDPAFQKSNIANNEKAIGLIATIATVESNIYPETLERMTHKVHFIQHGTRTLASVINNYPGQIALMRKHIREAIDPLICGKAIDTLLLGCTHYPIVRESIEEMYPFLKLINPAAYQVRSLEKYLKINDMAAPPELKEEAQTVINTTGTMADTKIFESMIDYLGIRCDRLSRCRLDID